MPEWTTSAPSRTSPSITFETFISLPGIGCDDRITVSSGPTSSHRLLRVAMSARADMGSPWLPVEITHTWPGGRSPTSSMSTRAWSGMRSSPISRASRTFFFIDRPSVATLRPNASAASAIC
jgi:hypothetical protein